VTRLHELHMDPPGPVPGIGDGALLDDVDEHAIDLLVEHTVGTPILSVEVRQLGGAIGRRDWRHGALDAFDASYALYAVGPAPTPELGGAVETAVARLRQMLAPWEAEHTYMNFADTRRGSSSLFSSASYHRLRRIKALVDPAELIRSNHPIPPAFH
jgi:hypothetical protein